MLLYVLKSAVTLALLYTCFHLLLRKETFHRFNRMVLIGILLTSVLLPIAKVTTNYPIDIRERLYAIDVRDRESNAEDESITVIEPTRSAPTLTFPSLFTLIQWVYGLGVVVQLLVLLWNTVVLKQHMNNGLCRTDAYGNTIILKRGDIEPFSFFHYIVMSIDDYDKYRTYILPHEQEHIRQGHSYDLLLLETVRILQWFNPFIKLLAYELKAVHEYAVDEALLKGGIDAKQYQRIIVTKAIYNGQQTFANHLYHGSLKQRIIMMYRTESKKCKMLKTFLMLPIVCFVLVCFAQPNRTKQIELQSQSMTPVDTQRLKYASDGWPIVEGLPLYDGPQKCHYRPSISRQNDGTYITFVCTSSADDELYKFGGPNCYLVDPNTGIHYKAKYSIPKEAWDYFHLIGMQGKTWKVTVVFPPIPEHIQEVEFYGVTSHLQNAELHNLNK